MIGMEKNGGVRGIDSIHLTRNNWKQNYILIYFIQTVASIQVSINGRCFWWPKGNLHENQNLLPNGVDLLHYTGKSLHLDLSFIRFAMYVYLFIFVIILKFKVIIRSQLLEGWISRSWGSGLQKQQRC